MEAILDKCALIWHTAVCESRVSGWVIEIRCCEMEMEMEMEMEEAEGSAVELEEVACG